MPFFSLPWDYAIRTSMGENGVLSLAAEAVTFPWLPTKSEAVRILLLQNLHTVTHFEGEARRGLQSSFSRRSVVIRGS